MRQYNKQQVMKDAHRLYGSEFHRKVVLGVNV